MLYSNRRIFQKHGLCQAFASTSGSSVLFRPSPPTRIQHPSLHHSFSRLFYGVVPRECLDLRTLPPDAPGLIFSERRVLPKPHLIPSRTTPRSNSYPLPGCNFHDNSPGEPPNLQVLPRICLARAAGDITHHDLMGHT